MLGETKKSIRKSKCKSEKIPEADSATYNRP